MLKKSNTLNKNIYFFFSNHKNQTVWLHRTKKADFCKKADFWSLKIFKGLIDAQCETFPKSCSSSENTKDLSTQFLSQGRCFIANFKIIDRFLPSVKGKQYEFAKKIDILADNINVYVCVYLSKCTCHQMQLHYKSYP